jgi:homoserine kinase type II
MAVYTEVSDEDLSAFLARYACGSLRSCKGIAEGVENTNYFVETDRGRFILTLYEKRVADADLPFFLSLKEHLARRGVSCPVPVRNRDGQALGELNGRKAALITFLNGVSVRHPRPDHCHEAGRALANLHLASADLGLYRANALGPSGWPALFARFAASADEILPGLAQLIADELEVHARGWPDGLPEGIIHADLFPDNVFFLDGRLSGLIDFYFACNDALAYDLAICLNAWCFDSAHVFVPAKGAALIAGYESVRQLTTAERQAMPILARGAALRFLLTRCYDWLNRPPGALVVPHDPKDYVARLKFHRSVAGIADYVSEAGRAA